MLLQPSRDCADFDVVLSGREGPSFRVLLPEYIHVGNQPQQEGNPFVHTIPGRWQREGDTLRGRLSVHDMFDLDVSVREDPRGIRATLRVRNVTASPLRHVSANICSGVTHLPGEPDWSNRDFVDANVPLDRSTQGRFWYEVTTPRGLKVLTPGGWREVHPNPENPSAEGLPPYGSVASEEETAVACAAKSLDGRSLFYQCWSGPSRWLTPIPGNACMHLLPKVADVLRPGEEASIHGAVGIFDGDWDELTEWVSSEMRL